MFKKLIVLTQTYKQKNLTKIAISSVDKFKPKNTDIEYYVIEGSNDMSYKEAIVDITPGVNWFNNESADSGNPIAGASTANGLNIEYGKKQIAKKYKNSNLDPWVFICHNDVAVQSLKFFEYLYEYSSKYGMISCCKDNTRIEACHISGLLVKNSILQNVNCMPELPGLDVGDKLTLYCRENNIPYVSLPNTHNTPDLYEKCTGIWQQIGKNSGVDRCIINDEVIFCHLGRGTPKSLDSYYKQGKVTALGWATIHQDYLR